MRLGTTEIILIIVLVLLLFGGGKLAGVGKALGKSIKDFKAEVKDDRNGQDQDKDHCQNKIHKRAGRYDDHTPPDTGSGEGTFLIDLFFFSPHPAIAADREHTPGVQGPFFGGSPYDLWSHADRELFYINAAGPRRYKMAPLMDHDNDHKNDDRDNDTYENQLPLYGQERVRDLEYIFQRISCGMGSAFVILLQGQLDLPIYACKTDLSL